MPLQLDDDSDGQIVGGPINNPNAPPVPAGLVATDEGVREMKLRWTRYSTFGEVSPKTSRSEELLAEIQARWRQYRGVDEKTGNMFRRSELRPELQTMCEPLDLRVNLQTKQSTLPDYPKQFAAGKPHAQSPRSMKRSSIVAGV